MNKVIDYNFYPVPETKVSNERHRPIGIGIQGFANLLYKLKIPFDSPAAKELNSQIMETIYYSAVSESCNLAQVFGSYQTFPGSPFSKGQFQFDLANVTVSDARHNWSELKQKVIEYGTRNALLTALMPTASTSNILGNYESFEPMHSNFFMRSVGSGDFPIINKYLVSDLVQLGLWNPEMSNEIVKGKGSIQGILEIPQELKDLYKTVYEISQKVLIDLSADRQLFVDQSQSLNVYIAAPSISKLSSMHFYGWSRGLKTGLYYLRSENGSSAEQFTVKGTPLACSLKNKDCAECSG
jgi:ribonucleoside-diphosphate reductase alpha chain